ncbi:MAG: tRNA (adenosine(37)-N6)-threonylcarbamoyltransferase complex ATPase subunit type 1 TsaE [Bacteroidetes bacterium]|nr:tRNA (adenosine(37)-N6)-threonylcarbamoyltransferase complex ATPase subunit type 1 TsaE [Bacteroidota bacterium]
MKTVQIRVQSPEELPEAAHQLIRFAGDQKVIAFFGAMGAGKTTFIKAICRELEVQDAVTSPTFALVNEYQSAAGEPVFHFDFYRIKNENEASDIGCEEYFSSGHICLVEWPEKILNLLPQEIVRVTIEVEHENRLLTFQR